MKKREWGALSFRVRKGTSLFFAGLLCFAMPAMAHAVEMSGEGQTEARPAKAVVENEPADDDALAIIAEEADVAEFGIAVSAQPEIRPEDADAGNAADNAEDSGDVVPDERESGLFPEGSSFRYQYADGTFAVDTWVVADDVRYYFGANGLAVAGRQKIEDCWYFFDDGCRMQTGWVTWKNGNKSFFDWDGRALLGWRSFSGAKYYFDPATGISKRWSQRIDGKWYYFDSSSRMKAGWVTWSDGTKSYFHPDSSGHAAALTGWRSFSGVKCYFDSSTGKSLRWDRKLAATSTTSIAQAKCIGDGLLGATARKAISIVADAHWPDGNLLLENDTISIPRLIKPLVLKVRVLGARAEQFIGWLTERFIIQQEIACP